jgi:hypothetical protein
METGLTDGLARISVGIENVEHVIISFDQTLAAIWNTSLIGKEIVNLRQVVS